MQKTASDIGNEVLMKLALSPEYIQRALSGRTLRQMVYGKTTPHNLEGFGNMIADVAAASPRAARATGAPASRAEILSQLA